MLNNIIEEEDDCFVFFYDDVDPDAHAILSELEGMYTVMFTYKIQTLMMQQQSIYIHNICKKSNHITSSCITFSLCLDIDEKLDKRDLHLVKISDDGAGEEYGIEDLPCLVYFENGVPEIFEGDIRNDNQIIKWMLDELKQVLDILWSMYNSMTTFFQQEIKHVTVPMLNRLIARNHNLAVVFMDENTSEGNMQYDK